MNKELVVSFFLAVCVVGGGLFGLAWFSDHSSVQQAAPAAAPAPDRTASGVAKADPCPGGKMIQGECHVRKPDEPNVWIREADLHRPKTVASNAINVAPGGVTAHERQRLAEFEAQQRADDAARAAQVAQVESNKDLCARIEDEIKAIDATTRQPLLPSLQDYYRKQRQALRDRQFSLHC